MASCARCGSELPAAARFCPTCGRPADPEMGPPAPPDAPPIWSSAGALALLRGRGSGVGTLVAAQPNPITVLFLALLWGLAGGLGAAFLWASRHNARWQLGQEAEAGGDPPEEKP